MCCPSLFSVLRFHPHSLFSSMSAADSTSTFAASINHLSFKPLTQIVIPDLVSVLTFDTKVNRHHEQAAAESEEWLFRGYDLDQKKRQAIHGIQAALLSSMCYPDVGYPQLRVCCDFMTYLFHLDDLSDDMENRETRAIADEVLNSLYHPFSYHSSARVGKMARE